MTNATRNNITENFLLGELSQMVMILLKLLVKQLISVECEFVTTTKYPVMNSWFLKYFDGPEKDRFVLNEEDEDLSLGWFLSLLGEKNGLDVGQDTALCDGDAGKKFV